MIEAGQRMIRVNSQGELGGMNPVIRRHLELEIKTLQNVPIEMQTSWSPFLLYDIFELYLNKG
jgi:hypothetical protein